MALTPGQLARWSPAHRAQVLGSRATAYGSATGKAQQRILDAARADQLAKKAASTVNLPHPGYTDQAFSQLVANDPNLVQIRQQRAQSAQGLTNANAYYDQYRQALEQARQQSNAGYGTAVANTQAQTAGARTLDTADAQRVLAAARADAALRGQTVDPALAATFAAATANRAAQGGAYGSLLGGIGANANSYLADRGATAVGQKTQYGLNQQANDAALARGYGQTKSATALKLSGQLANQDLQQQVAAQTLGIKAQSAQTSAQTAASNAHNRAANRKLARMKFSSAQAKDTYERQHHLGPYKPVAAKTPKSALNPKQQLDEVGRIDGLPQLIKTYMATTTKDATTGKPRPLTQDEIYSGLIQKGYKMWEIHIAQQLRLKKGVDSNGLHLLHTNGVHKIPARWLKQNAAKPILTGSQVGPGQAQINLGSG